MLFELGIEIIKDYFFKQIEEITRARGI